MASTIVAGYRYRLLLYSALAICGALSRSTAEERTLAVDSASSSNVPTAGIRGHNAEAVAFSPDGRLVAAAFGGAPSDPLTTKLPAASGVLIWETESGKLLSTHGEYGDILKLRFSHDGKSLVYSRIYTPGDSVDDDVVVALDVTTGKTLTRFRNDSVFGVAMNNQVFVQRGQHCESFNLRGANNKGRKVHTDDFAFEHLSMSADGSRFAAAQRIGEPIVRDDGTPSLAKRSMLKGLGLFDTNNHQAIVEVQSDELNSCTALRLSPDGKRLITVHKNLVRFWDTSSLKEIQVLRVPFNGYVCPAFSPDGKQLALLTQQVLSATWKYTNTATGLATKLESIGDRTELWMYDIETAKVDRRWTFENGAFPTWHWGTNVLDHDPRRVAFSPDGRYLLVGCNDVVLINATTGKVVRKYDRNQSASAF